MNKAGLQTLIASTVLAILVIALALHLKAFNEFSDKHPIYFKTIAKQPAVRNYGKSGLIEGTWIRIQYTNNNQQKSIFIEDPFVAESYIIGTTFRDVNPNGYEYTNAGFNMPFKASQFYGISLVLAIILNLATLMYIMLVGNIKFKADTE